MRVIVFFDLPTLTAADLRSYRQFRKGLIKEGFIMLQELVLNANVASQVRDRISKICPSDGIVQLMIITEKQYSDIEYLVGNASGDVISCVERTVEL